MLDNIKQTHVIGFVEVGEKRMEEILEEKKAKNFPRLMKDNKSQIPEAHRTSNRIKSKADQKYLIIS